MCSRVSGLGSSDIALPSRTMNTRLSIACAQCRAGLAPGLCSQVPTLRIGPVAGVIQGLKTSRCVRQRCHSLGHSLASCFDEVDRVGSSSNKPGLCDPVGGHGMVAMLEVSSEAQCSEGDQSRRGEHVEDHLKDQVRDELAGREWSLHSDAQKGSDESSSSLAIHSERVEELTKVVQSLSQSLLFCLGHLESGMRQNVASSKGSPGVDGINQSALRREVSKSQIKEDSESPMLASSKSTRRTGPQRSMNGKAGSRRQNLKLKEHIEAMKEIREDDVRFMREALAEAKKAANAGEVPVGAVVVQKGKIISRAYNRVESAGDPTAHAEMLCLRSAARHHGNWRLGDATLYVTLEPCPMCAGAILQSRVKGVVWGSRNTLLGADGSWVSLFPELVEDIPSVDSKSEQEPCSRPSTHPFHTSLEVRRGVLADECSAVMRAFFRARREVNGSSIKTKPWWLPLPVWVLFKRLLQLLPFLKRVSL